MTPPPKRRPGRPVKHAAKAAEALALMAAEDITAEVAAERVGIGGNTVRRAMRAGMAPAELVPVAPVKVAVRPPSWPPDRSLPPATDNDRKVDELIATSRTWRRVQEALARFARRHPTIAPDLAAELRGLNL